MGPFTKRNLDCHGGFSPINSQRPIMFHFSSVSALIDGLVDSGYHCDAIEGLGVRAHRGVHQVFCTRTSGDSVSVSDGRTEVIVSTISGLATALLTLVELA